MSDPLYENGEPKYFDDKGTLILHLDRPFKENFEAWGDKFYELVTDQSRMKENLAYLSSLPLDTFREALASCTWGSMVRVWKAKQEGKVEEKRAKHNGTTRRGDRKRDVSNCLKNLYWH